MVITAVHCIYDSVVFCKFIFDKKNQNKIHTSFEKCDEVKQEMCKTCNHDFFQF